MATSRATIDYLLEQMAPAGSMSARKMFGEYALYLSGKVVALVCNDQLFIKPTEAGRKKLEQPQQGFPYPGARPWFVVSGETWEDAEWLVDLVVQTAAALPPPQFKKPKRIRATAIKDGNHEQH